MRELIFKGQKFKVSFDEGFLQFHIKEPFYSAGKQFGWFGASIGLGINKQALEYAIANDLSIRVIVGSKPSVYECTSVSWKLFCDTHNSFMIRGNAEICVIQWNKEHFKKVA